MPIPEQSYRYNLSKFDFVSVRLAVYCARSGSLTIAARDANMALAAASRRIRQLESVLGEELFERHPRGLLLTPAGRVFLKYGVSILQMMDQLGEELNDLRLGIASHISLCASTAAISQFLPPLLAQYAAQHPQVHVDLEEQVSAGVVAALRDRRADIGIFVEGPDTNGLKVKLFRHDELVLVLPPRHRLTAMQRPIAFAECLDEQWISLTAGAALLQKQREAAMLVGKPLKLKMQVRSFDAVCHMVASGLGIAVLPRTASEVIAHAMDLELRTLADDWAKRRILAATVEGHSDKHVASLLEFLTDPSQNAKPSRRKKK